MIIVYILTVIISYLIWTYIHEMSHIIAAHLTVGVIRWKINLFLMLENFPHNIKNMRFAECIYYPKREIMSREKGIISLAPRIPDIVFAFLTPITALVNEPYCYILTILFGGSLIDLFVDNEFILNYQRDQVVMANEVQDLLHLENSLEIVYPR